MAIGFDGRLDERRWKQKMVRCSYLLFDSHSFSRLILNKERRPCIKQFVPVEATSIKQKLEDLPTTVSDLFTNHIRRQVEGTTQLRELLSIERPVHIFLMVVHMPPIQEVVEANNGTVVPRLVEFLSREDFPQIQFNAAWILTNIASGLEEHTQVVIDHGAVPIFVKLLRFSSNDNIREQVIWALGTIAAGSPGNRDLVLDHGALDPLLNLFTVDSEPSILRKAAWTLTSLCTHTESPESKKAISSSDKRPGGEANEGSSLTNMCTTYDSQRAAETRPALAKRLLPTLVRNLYSEDNEVLAQACWALSYITESTCGINTVIDICPRLVELLVFSPHSVILPTIRTIGHIVAGNVINAKIMIAHGVLRYLLKFLTDCHDKNIKKLSCLAIYYITSEKKEHIQSAIEAGIIGPLIKLLQNDEVDVKREAARAIMDAIYGGSHDQIKYIVSQGCINAICDWLMWLCRDRRIVSNQIFFIAQCLDGLDIILFVGNSEKGFRRANLYKPMVRDSGVLSRIQNLQARDPRELAVINKKVGAVLDYYYYDKGILVENVRM